MREVHVSEVNMREVKVRKEKGVELSAAYSTPFSGAECALLVTQRSGAEWEYREAVRALLVSDLL